ncbi:hypothetical protein OZL92_05980 [Bacillus sonorensis]|uniref:Transmembrane protein n=2 Tax=Bacillus sonorensis TaxID=119858 RepID=M5P1D7_9BACI|nr:MULTISPECIES: hypothetical protein [Bacillus]ASB91512.1 hypothetical protein S101395_05029 [Bacillus sonorensis]EME73876.1 transmembrane protein [Bacillus sonorensis L12]MBG9914809.1 membrane protein [Bacillus sonorensis]MCF7615886.1 hypothetical protein [Bacillus sonorensis]MCY7858191.1 hypothetical protein [Bacillus sonorensis]
MNDNVPMAMKALSSMKSKSMISVFVLCVVTLGIYIPYWFLSRKKVFELLPYLDIPYTTLKVMIVYHLCTIPLRISAAIVFTEMHYSLFLLLHRITIILSAAVLIYCALSVTAAINKLSGDEPKKGTVFAFLLNVFYIQHRINKFSEPKRGYITKAS